MVRLACADTSSFLLMNMIELAEVDEREQVNAPADGPLFI